jgi:hypothetical protein
MPRKPNYDYEKRQKEMARKQKQDLKRARKREEEQAPDAGPQSQSVEHPASETE